MSLQLQVMAAVFGPRETEMRSQELQDRAVIKCEYAMAPFSTGRAPQSASRKANSASGASGA